jgi:hypothetical protein
MLVLLVHAHLTRPTLHSPIIGQTQSRPAHRHADYSGVSVIQLIRAAHSHPRSRAVAAASVRLRAPNLVIAEER